MLLLQMLGVELLAEYIQHILVLLGHRPLILALGFWVWLLLLPIQLPQSMSARVAY
jgi:hypothetical protein